MERERRNESDHSSCRNLRLQTRVQGEFCVRLFSHLSRLHHREVALSNCRGSATLLLWLRSTPWNSRRKFLLRKCRVWNISWLQFQTLGCQVALCSPRALADSFVKWRRCEATLARRPSLSYTWWYLGLYRETWKVCVVSVLHHPSCTLRSQKDNLVSMLSRGMTVTRLRRESSHSWCRLQSRVHCLSRPRFELVEGCSQRLSWALRLFLLADHPRQRLEGLTLLVIESFIKFNYKLQFIQLLYSLSLLEFWFASLLSLVQVCVHNTLMTELLSLDVLLCSVSSDFIAELSFCTHLLHTWLCLFLTLERPYDSYIGLFL